MIFIERGIKIMLCELCETLKDGKLVNGRCLVKLDEHTYELQLWELIGFAETEQYELFATTEVKWCPDCGKRLGDMQIEDLNFGLYTYNCLKNARINWLSELRNLKYDDLVQIKNLSQSNILEIQEVLKRY
jgi:DNA-directed RNA polymerase alpha subunit